MPALLYNIAGTVVFSLIQLVAGCLLAIAIFAVFRNRSAVLETTPKTVIIISLLCSFCGIILPLGIYGAIPIVAALLAVGFKTHAIGSLLVSNVMFNMLVPFNEPSFIWKTGYRQVIFAFIAGFLAGILLSVVKNENGIIRLKNMPTLPDSPSKLKMFLLLADDSIRKLGLFLVVGVAADAVFQRFILSNVINAFYSNSITAAIPQFFGGHDVSNPFFLLTFTIMYMLMNLVNLSVLAAILKLGGLVRYYAYYILWAVILAIPAFI